MNKDTSKPIDDRCLACFGADEPCIPSLSSKPIDPMERDLGEPIHSAKFYEPPTKELEDKIEEILDYYYKQRTSPSVASPNQVGIRDILSLINQQRREAKIEVLEELEVVVFERLFNHMETLNYIGNKLAELKEDN